MNKITETFKTYNQIIDEIIIKLNNIDKRLNEMEKTLSVIPVRDEKLYKGFFNR
jgi:hypothetical protein